MNVNRSFSHDIHWNCLDLLVAKYPIPQQRSITSKLIREAVELFSKYHTTKQTTSLDDYKDGEISPSLDLDKKIWKKMSKSEDTKKLKELEMKMIGRLAIIKTEIYERTL